MNNLYKLLVLALVCLASCEGCDPKPKVVIKKSEKTNYGSNIIVVTDLSNRILNQRRYEDPEVVSLITQHLKAIFQKSAEVGINAKFYLTTVNDKDFHKFNYSDSIFKLDLTRFGTNAVGRSDYLHHNDKTENSLRHDLERLNGSFTNFYNDLKTVQQFPADMWYFFQDKLTYPIVDTSTDAYDFEGSRVTNRYKNYIILLTDGYIEAGRYANNQSMVQGNQARFLSGSSVDNFRNEFNSSGIADYKTFFTQKKYGVMPVQNALLKDCKVLVLELYDRSLVNGVTSKTPTDAEILKLFWADWLSESGVQPVNVTLKETFSNKQNLDVALKIFLDVE